MTATFVLHEFGGGAALQERHVAYLRHAATSGEHPRLSRLLAQGSPAQEPQAPPTGPVDRYPDVLARVLSGLLGPHP
jgi:hypothetical protein